MNAVLDAFARMPAGVAISWMLVENLLLFTLALSCVVFNTLVTVAGWCLWRSGQIVIRRDTGSWVSRPFLKHVGTSTFHAGHHRDADGNFGFYTLLWDRLFGTLHPGYGERFGRGVESTGDRSAEQLAIASTPQIPGGSTPGPPCARRFE